MIGHKNRKLSKKLSKYLFATGMFLCMFVFLILSVHAVTIQPHTLNSQQII